MQQTTLTVASNRALTGDVSVMELQGDLTHVTRPGQFVDLRLEGFYLRRPISVCDWTDDRLTIIYKVVGAGTAALRGYGPGRRIDALVGLGNGYDTSRAGQRPLLLGGGVGVPPLYGLARRLREKGLAVRAAFGFNRAADAFWLEEFRALGCEVAVATLDGSLGEKGFVTDILPEDATFYYACGPLPMLKAVHKRLDLPGQLSLEERMGCGFGACMGCSIETKEGPRRVCKDGPVFDREVLPW